MTTTVLTTKGQIVIPSRIRKQLRLKKGSKFCVLEDQGRIVLQPMDRQYFSQVAGMLNTKGELLHDLLSERKKEKAWEDA